MARTDFKFYSNYDIQSRKPNILFMLERDRVSDFFLNDRSEHI